MLPRLSQKLILVSCGLFSVFFLLLSIPDRKPLVLRLNRVILTFKIRALGRYNSDAFKVYIRPVALHAN